MNPEGNYCNICTSVATESLQFLDTSTSLNEFVQNIPQQTESGFIMLVS